MQPVLNVEDVRRVEQDLTAAGVSLAELMRRAGHAAAQEVLNLGDVEHVIVFAGPGNNGGDGWVAAELLHRAGASVEVVCSEDPAEIQSPLEAMVAKSAQEAGVSYVVAPSKNDIERRLQEASVALDGIFGTGFHGEIHAPYDIWIDAINESGIKVVSIDVPSGISAQTGEGANPYVMAEVTVTMISLKPGLISGKGRDACGAIVVAPLAEQSEKFIVDADPVAWRVDTADYVDVIPTPTVDIDKYSRGSVLVVAGSKRYPGAAILAAEAAARAGAGYVTLCVPSCIATVCRTHLTSIPVVALPSSDSGTFAISAKADLIKLAKSRDVVVAGPGMGVSADTVSLVTALLETKVPLVLDADALNSMARMTTDSIDNFPELIRREAPLVLTPHRKELGRLVGMNDAPPESLASSMEAARRIVWADGGSDICVIAKGESTACVGVEIALLPKPGPLSLATAGTGDILAGIVGAFLARHMNEEDVLPLMCAMACETHATAARLAAEEFGLYGALSSDIVKKVGLALDNVEERTTLLAATEMDS